MKAALLLAALLLAAAAPPPAVPLYREFGRWFVACDNVRSCEARGFDDTTRTDLRLLRQAGDAAATLIVSAETGFDSTTSLDGQPLNLSAWSAAAPSTTAVSTLSTNEPAAVTAFIEAARNARTLSLTPPDRDRPRTVALDGFTAALLLIDAVQGRPGTTAPLVAEKGPAMAPPAQLLPLAPPWIRPPALSRDEARRLGAQAAHLVSPDYDPCTVTDTPPEVHALDATSAIAIRPCYNAAYQGSSVVAILRRRGGKPIPVQLALPGLSRPVIDGPDMVDPGFDPATGTRGPPSKGRGLADCGSSESWVWSHGAFHLKDFSYQGQCGGALPGDWPPLYRTR